MSASGRRRSRAWRRWWGADPPNSKPRINLRADEGVRRRELMAVMSRLRVAGFDKVALVGEAL